MMKVITRRMLMACVAMLAVGVLVMPGCSDDAQHIDGETEGEAAIELQIFAANSLSKAMEEAQGLYMETHEGISFKDAQYLGSGDLNAQLQAGAYADVLISASSGKMNDAAEAGLIDETSHFDMFANDLVMVVAEDSDIASITLEDIATGKYTVAVGDDSVPAGNYANQALSTVGCFVDPDGKVGKESAGKANGTDAYAGTPLEGKVNLQSSVGNVCQQVSANAVDVAFVYSSDVYRFDGVRVAGTVSSDVHKDIVYPAAICSMSENSEPAQAFLEWLATDEEAISILEKWGFEVL